GGLPGRRVLSRRSGQDEERGQAAGGLSGSASYSQSVKSSVRIRAALAEQRGRLAEYRPAATERDVQRCRVATRRLRAIARATRPLLGDLLIPVQAELGWMAGVLEPVRDLDVLLVHLRPQIETLDDDVDGAKLVVAALERQRLFRVKELKAAIESVRY